MRFTVSGYLLMRVKKCIFYICIKRLFMCLLGLISLTICHKKNWGSTDVYNRWSQYDASHTFTFWTLCVRLIFGNYCIKIKLICPIKAQASCMDMRLSDKSVKMLTEAPAPKHDREVRLTPKTICWQDSQPGTARSDRVDCSSLNFHLRLHPKVNHLLQTGNQIRNKHVYNLLHKPLCNP